MPSIYPSLLVLLDASTRNLIVMLAICYPAQPGRDERPTDTPRCVKADRHWGALGTTQPSPAQGSVETSHPPGRSQGKMRGQANKPTNSPRNNAEASKESLRPGVDRGRQKGPPNCPQRSPPKRSLVSPSVAWRHLALPGVAWRRLVSPGVTWCSPSPATSTTHTSCMTLLHSCSKKHTQSHMLRKT